MRIPAMEPLLRNAKFVLAADEEARTAYYHLRAREYQRVFGFEGAWLQREDEYDRSGAILIHTNSEGRILCGARMNICRAFDGGATRLPMEKEGFRLPALLPSMNLGSRCYAEVSRLAVAEGHQDGTLLLNLLDALHEYARSQEAPLVFSICPRAQARMYRILQRTNRMQKGFHVLEDIAVPSQFGIEMRLCLFAEEGEV
jgi:hypothetical protein